MLSDSRILCGLLQVSRHDTGVLCTCTDWNIKHTANAVSGFAVLLLNTTQNLTRGRCTTRIETTVQCTLTISNTMQYLSQKRGVPHRSADTRLMYSSASFWLRCNIKHNNAVPDWGESGVLYRYKDTALYYALWSVEHNAVSGVSPIRPRTIAPNVLKDRRVHVLSPTSTRTNV